MEALPTLLRKQGYKKIKFIISKTNHLLVKAKVNGVRGVFILDTGASNSCVGFESVDWFQLQAKSSNTQASGAGAIGMLTQLAQNNTLQIGRWHSKEFHLVIFDLSHVNMALLQHNAKTVHGIIGADVLMESAAIIDYHNQLLYMK